MVSLAASSLFDPLNAHPYACAYIANAQILDQATRSVKSRRKVKKAAAAQGDAVRTRKKPSTPPAATTSSSSFARTKLALQDAMLQASKLMEHGAATEEVEVLRTSRQSTGSTKLSRRPATPGTAMVSRRKRTNKALPGHATRKSRDLRSSKQVVEEMLKRPLPSLPAGGAAVAAKHEQATVKLSDESPIVPQAFTMPSSSKPAKHLVYRKLVPQVQETQCANNDDNDDSTDDWATFIASGYRDFPMPPASDIRETMAAALRNRQEAKVRMTTTKAKRRSAAIAPIEVQGSNAAASKTGVDWLDDELARASGGEEDREELRTVNTPRTASSVGLGLTRSARTPPSSSVDTFQSQPTPPPQLPPKSDDDDDDDTRWRLSRAKDVFVTPNSSPQIDYGHVVMTAPSASPAMVKQIADLAQAQVGRRPSCASAHKVHFVNDAAAAAAAVAAEQVTGVELYKRHDSVSSAASSAASRDFSVADSSSSTRRTSIGGGSECSSVMTNGARIVSPPRPMRSDAADLTMLANYSIHTPASRRISAASSEGRVGVSPRTSTAMSDSSSSSSPLRRRAASRVAAYDEGAPPTPIRTVSLQNQQASKRSMENGRRPPLLGAWMEGSSAYVKPVPMTHSQSSPGVTNASAHVPKTSTEVLAALRQQKASQSYVDLSLRTSMCSDDASSGEKGKSGPGGGLRSLFGGSTRQRRQSTTVAPPDFRNLTIDGALNASSVTLTGKKTAPPKKLTLSSRSRSSSNLDRLLAKMSGSPIDVLLPPRPMADVPITPASADHADMPDSPSNAIFGSAASFLGGAGGGVAGSSALHAAMAAHCSKQTSEQMRQFAEASHAARRTSSVCVTDMPTQLAGDVAAMERHMATCNRKMGGSLSRATSMRKHGSGGSDQTRTQSSLKHSSTESAAPAPPSKDTTTTAAMRAARQANKSTAPPSAFWRRNGGVQDCGDEEIEENIDTADVQSQTTTTSRPTMRRKSSFTLWR